MWAAELGKTAGRQPIHYQERLDGVTKMVSVLTNGLVMSRMCLAAGVKLKGGY